MWKGGSEQHLLTPLPGVPRVPRAPGAPRASSKTLDAAMFYHDFCTVALPFFVEKLYFDGFYNDFQPTRRFLAISSHIPGKILADSWQITEKSSGEKLASEQVSSENVSSDHGSSGQV